MSARWYKRCGADFIHGTMMLTLEEKGAYSLCLDLIYDRGGPIADDARWLSGVCGVSIRKWNSIRERLVSLGKIQVQDGLLDSTDYDPAAQGDVRTPLPLSIRAKVEAAWDGRCAYCSTTTGPFEVDHIHPVRLGGSDEVENLTMACRTCNRSKGGKPLSEWIR